MLKKIFVVTFFTLVHGLCFGFSANRCDTSGTPGHFRQPVKNVTDSVNGNVESLRSRFAQHKTIPKAYEGQILFALSYFPDLANSRIIFKIKKTTDGIIDTRPTVGSIFRRSSKRTYIVFIHDSTAGRKLPAFANADANGQVGILGHELCHIVYFNHRTGLGLVGLGIMHISRTYIDRFEYATDSANIARGLGYQLLAWKEYLTNRFGRLKQQQLVDIPKIEARRRYMSVAEINAAIAGNKIYQ